METLPREVLDIRTGIRNTEALSDELLAAMASLKLKMLSFRSHPDVEPHAAQKAFMRLQRAEQNLVASANDLFRTHDELLDTATRMGIEHPDFTQPSGLADIAVGTE
ncbi:hypothetical protein [Altererythrobacter sp.]|uniref:hypothetical protein n=1 Tax=Altererythrobacter sp. TaxID=1872480 RepID=UPI003D09D8B6